MNYRQFHLTLRHKAMLVMLTIITLTLAILATAVIIQVHRHIELSEMRAATSMARSLGGAAELALAVKDIKELDRLIKGFLWERQVRFIAVYDERGQVLASTGQLDASYERYTGPIPSTAETLVAEHQVQFAAITDEFSIFSGEQSEHKPSSTPASDDSVGRVVVGLSTIPMHMAQRINTWIVIGIAAAAAAAGTVCVSWIVNRWAGRLDPIVEASDRLSRGEFTTTTIDEGTDEIGRLAKAFNHMCEAVRQRDAELREFNVRLQERVEHRTRALVDAKAVAEKAAADLQESEERTRAIVDSALDGIMTACDKGQIQSANPAAQQIFAYSEEQLCEFSLPDLIKPGKASNETIVAYLHRSKDMDAVFRHEAMGACAGGMEIPVYLAISPFELGDRRMYTVIIHDQSESKQLQRQLAQAQKLEAIGQLAAGVAHEINTPIQFVGDNMCFLKEAFSDLREVQDQFATLLESVPADGKLQAITANIHAAIEQADLQYLNEEIPAALEQAAEGVDRVARIVRSMKEFAHPGSEGFVPVDLNHAIENTITVARNEWKYVADVVTELAADLPPVPCLPGELNQVVLNLIVNAAHAVEERNAGESTKGLIRIATSRNDQSVIICVSDTGNGIPPEVRERVFDPFFTTKQVGKGTGQGLSIAYNVIVEKHNGSINFQTEPGHGTTFTVELPLIQTPKKETEAA